MIMPSSYNSKGLPQGVKVAQAKCVLSDLSDLLVCHKNDS